MHLKLSNNTKNKVGNAIIITGSARSGSTIIGKVIHSMKDVEYLFEPPTLFSLIPLINSINVNDWKLLYETHLYEDFLINAVSGRAINCNKSDDSSIYNVKNISEISNRLKNSISKIEAERISSAKFIAYKMPDITAFMPKLIDYYPKSRVVFIKRGPVATINSLLQKNWYSDKSLSMNIIWPFRMSGSVKVPFWVNDEDTDLWCSLNEVDRCGYYYIQMNKVNLSNKITISYEELVANPHKIVSNLASSLDLKLEKKTYEIINTIKVNKIKINTNILSLLSPKIKDEIICLI